MISLFIKLLTNVSSSFEVLRLAGMRKVKTDGGAITRYTLLRLKNPEKSAKIVRAAFKIETDKLREAKNNKEESRLIKN